jgi:hypothetical protein
VKTVPIKARDDGKACALPRSATQSGAVFTPFPAGCDQKGRARRCKALPGSTPPSFCALRTAFLTHNASPENRVKRPLDRYGCLDCSVMLVVRELKIFKLVIEDRCWFAFDVERRVGVGRAAEL